MPIQSQARCLIRKISSFGERLDQEYSRRGRDAAFEDSVMRDGPDKALVDALKEIVSFKIFSKNHILCHEGTVINHMYIIKDVWVRRCLKAANQKTEDLLGRGTCFGLEEPIMPLPGSAGIVRTSFSRSLE